MQVVAITLVALAMVPALAHLLEFPGKRRLSREAYLTVQPIYYPGFTVAGGVGEVGGLLSVFVVSLLTPREGVAFWLTLLALCGMLAMHIVFWLITQPVNKFWLQSTDVGNFGAAFFNLRSASHARSHDYCDDWTKMRDRWEYSHLARAVLAMVSFLALVVAAVIPG